MGLKIGFFVGKAGKSRGQSPRYLCHVIKCPDDRLRESYPVKSLIYSLNPYLDYFEEQTLSPKPLQHSARTVITIIAVSDKFLK